MKQLMITKINEYYGEDCDMKVLNKAMLLDPRFKNALFVSFDILLPELIETARKTPLHSNRTSRSSTNNSSITIGPSTSSHKKYGNEGKLMKLLTDIIHSSDDVQIEPVDKVKMEFQRYLSDVVTDQFDANGNLDPLQW